MKYFMTIILLIIFEVNIFCQNILLQNNQYIEYPIIVFEFENDNISLFDYSKDEPIKVTGKYILEYDNNIPYINISWSNGKNDRYLILYNENLCYLYDSNSKQYFRGFQFHGGAPGELCIPGNSEYIEATSYLKEGNKIYSPDCLKETIEECWAEGVDGNGINEILYIKNSNVSTIHFSIGFVSYYKNYLYTENSRPKKLELSVDGKYSIVIDLKDTPNFQSIKLPEMLSGKETLRIEILEVYQGTKYNDTCINMILLDMKTY
jgi:hypothetical protein